MIVLDLDLGAARRHSQGLKICHKNQIPRDATKNDVFQSKLQAAEPNESVVKRFDGSRAEFA